MTEHSETMIAQTERYSAHNYKPLPVVIAEGAGCWVTDVDGKRYLDMLSAYSALNQGHRHPRIIGAMKQQLERVTLTSRAFYNDQMGGLCEDLVALTGLDRVLPMNSGAEGVETALKAARKWGYEVKKVAANQAEIIVFSGNFHGRTISIVSFSTEPQNQAGFGPLTPGFRVVPFGDITALEAAITANTVGVLIEPIQGEGGVIMPPEGFLRDVRALCTKHRVLMINDEIQVGLGRTGRMFCYEHEDAKPDLLILGKALGGGLYPVSAVIGIEEVMAVFRPGDHGSTFGGNPLACAVARESLRVLKDERLAERAAEMGVYFRQRLVAMNSPHVEEVRGKGLLIGVQIKKSAGLAKPYCYAMMKEGILAKDTHEQVIRFAPPLVITQEELDWACERIERILCGAALHK
ncbi:ornithine--oxo-acid transaminase [Myxococcota bacterium]|nr:ornithine--oxo-acid transaminase [Myxococcota bacterium]